MGELPQRGRVEGPRLHLLHPAAGHQGAAELAQPAAQLAGGPGRERNRKDACRVHHAGRHRVGDPVRDGPGLASAGARQHAHRAPGRERDLPLLGIECGQHFVGAGPGMVVRAVHGRTSCSAAIFPGPADTGRSHGKLAARLRVSTERQGCCGRS